MPSTRTYHTEAITLKATPFAERDRLLILFTRYHGKLRVLAKGVRRTTSRLAGHTDIYSHSTLFLVHGRTFDSVTQGQTIERFSLLHHDLWRYSLACYVAELIDQYAQEELSNPSLFDAVLLILRQLNDNTLDPDVCVRAFELTMLGLVGYRPQLHRCVQCETIIQQEDNYMSYADGGILCPTCGKLSGTAVPIAMETLRILRNLQTRPETLIGKVRISQETLQQAEQIMIGYIQYLLDVRIRSVGFIDTLRRLRSIQQERNFKLD